MGFNRQFKECELSARTKRLDGSRDAAIRSTGFVRTWRSDHDKRGRKPRCSRIELRLGERLLALFRAMPGCDRLGQNSPSIADFGKGLSKPAIERSPVVRHGPSLGMGVLNAN
jgi:hypothetical protein